MSPHAHLPLVIARLWVHRIFTFASLLREDDASAQERGGYLDNLQIGIRSLNTILSNMLCFSKNPVPSREPIVISDLLAEVFSFLGPLLERRQIEVVWDKADCGALELDPEMMHQVFTNLALNALQALPEGGRIYLRTFEARDGVTVSICDNGLGIPKPFQEDIFEPQFSTNRNGNGLGLAIVQRLVQAHGGRIAVESKEGWGTCFTIVFPRRTSTVNEILIVDDEQQILVALQETLKRKGYTVSTAGSAVEALREAVRTPFFSPDLTTQLGSVLKEVPKRIHQVNTDLSG